MKKSSAIILVALIMFSSALTFTSHTSAQDTSGVADVKVLNYSYRIEPSYGMLIIMGEAQNIGSSILQDVVIGATVLGSDGSQIGTSAGNVYATNIVPGEKVPFEIDIYSPSSSSGSWLTTSIGQIKLTAVQAKITDSYPYPNLKITSQSTTVDTSGDTKGTFWVTGTLQNTGSQTAQNIYVIATFYNASGITVWAGWCTKIDTLAASSSTTFKTGAFDLNMSMVTDQQKIAGYSLVVQAGSPTQTGTPPDASTYTTIGGTVHSSSTYPSDSDTSGTPMPSYNGGNTGGNASGSFDYTWLIYGGIIAIIVVAVAITIMRLPKRRTEKQKAKRKTVPSSKTPPKKL